MALYTLKINVAFANNAYDGAPTWSDISSDCKGFSIRRGRTYEMGRIEAGTATILLNNASGNYWKNNAGGSYYPNVVPMKQANVQAVYGGTTYNLFTGFSESWTPGFVMPPIKAPEVTLSCVDLIKALSRTIDTTTSFNSEASGTRVGNLLNYASWPAGLRTVAAGVSTLQAISVSSTAPLNIMTHLFALQNSEQGLFFMGADGKAVFQDRHTRLAAPYTTSQYTFTDTGNTKCYTKIVPTNDDQYIYNDVHVTRTGGTEQVAQDTSSITSYGLRSLSLTGQLVTTDGECLSLAQFLVGKYAQPAQRIKQLEVTPERDPTNLYPVVFGLYISSRITVVLTQASVSEDYYIEGITHTYEPGKPWRTVYDLSPATTSTQWLLGTANYGELGTHTQLSY